MKMAYRTGTKDWVNCHVIEVLFHKCCFNLNEKLSGITPGCSVYRGSLYRCPVVYFFLAEKSGQRPGVGVGTPGNSLWGCAARFSKSGIE